MQEISRNLLSKKNHSKENFFLGRFPLIFFKTNYFFKYKVEIVQEKKVFLRLQIAKIGMYLNFSSVSSKLLLQDHSYAL